MPSYVERICKLVPPPKRPREIGSTKAWREIESKLGLELPDDYKKLTTIYGTGQWQQFWMLLNPFTKNRFLNFSRQAQRGTRGFSTALDGERYLRDDPDYPYPNFPIYPEAGGLIKWAGTDNGGNFFWLTKGSPSRWPIIYCPRHEYVEYKVSCSRFLLGVLTGDIPVFAQEFGSDYLYGQSDAFVPFRLTANGGEPVS